MSSGTPTAPGGGEGVRGGRVAGGAHGPEHLRALTAVVLDALAEAAPARGGPLPAGGPEAVEQNTRALCSPVLPEEGIGPEAALGDLVRAVDEVLLDLLRSRPEGAEGLTWLAHTRLTMEYSKIGLEQFTPDYTRYFHGLPQATRTLPPRVAALQGRQRGHARGHPRRAVPAQPRRRLADVTLTPGIEVTGATTTGRGAYTITPSVDAIPQITRS
ncbi:hypothetical protein SBADM41S_08543 [Streptomyces badius]